jgi:hypothetical protein
LVVVAHDIRNILAVMDWANSEYWWVMRSDLGLFCGCDSIPLSVEIAADYREHGLSKWVYVFI